MLEQLSWLIWVRVWFANNLFSITCAIFSTHSNCSLEPSYRNLTQKSLYMEVITNISVVAEWRTRVVTIIILSRVSHWESQAWRCRRHQERPSAIHFELQNCRRQIKPKCVKSGEVLIQRARRSPTPPHEIPSKYAPNSRTRKRERNDFAQHTSTGEAKPLLLTSRNMCLEIYL